MPGTGRYKLYGSNGSPYSMKLRAILRYRRIPHDWVLRTDRNISDLASVKPQLIPVLRYPEDGSLHVDSTPIALDLETRHPEGRSILPEDPVHAFLCHLIEDMADEWLPKAMFWYRWARPDDIEYAGYWIADDMFPDAVGKARDDCARRFATRQIDRMAMVGSTAENAPIIEASYLRLLDLLKEHVGHHRYLFGSRPSLADFAIFGQLRPMAQDPTAMAIMRDRAQRVESWVRQLDDASGLEGDWLGSAEPLPAATVGLLQMADDLYLPFLAANAEAAASGQDTFSMTLDGRPYGQAVFGYQAKCLVALRARFQEVSEEARTQIVAYIPQSENLLK